MAGAVKTQKSTVKRRPRAASVKTPPEWLIEALSGGKSYAGTYVTESSALSVAAVFACVRAVAEDVAKVPLVLKRVATDGTKTDASEHSLYSLLRSSPNPDMTALTFRRTVTAAALLWGNGYAEIVRDGSGRVLRLDPIHPSRVQVNRSSSGQLYYDVRNEDGNDVAVDQSRMLHIPGIGSGVVGYSMLKLGKQAIGVMIAAERFAQTFFGNGTRLSGVLEHPGQIGDAAAKMLRESWNALHVGPENAHKIAILEEGMKFNQTSVPPNDAQMLETRVMGVNEACRLFRVPPHKIFELTRSTNNNIEHQAIEYVGDALYTWFVAWEQEIKRKLLLARESDLEPEHYHWKLIQGDMAARSTRQRELFNIGAISINEIRRENGMNPIGPDGDVYYVNAALVPVDIAKLGPQKSQPQPTQPAQQTDAPDHNDQEDDGDPMPTSRRAQRLAAVIPHHRDLLKEKLEILLQLESDRVISAAKRGGFAEWANKFFGDHAMYVHGKIAGVVDAFTGAAWAILSNKPMPDTAKQAVFNATRAIATRHTEKSVAETREPQIVSEWPTVRAGREADEEIDHLAELMLTLTGVEQ